MEIIERIASGEPTASLTVPFELRQKSRLLTQLDNGEKAALFLPRGTVLRQGDLLRSRCGRVIEVRAAAETVSTVTTTDALLLARAAYHLGNRHVALEIASGRLRYLHDSVLDTLVRQLGLTVAIEQAPFEPEAGAYGGHHHDH
jgi:urease accessory protein